MHMLEIRYIQLITGLYRFMDPILGIWKGVTPIQFVIKSHWQFSSYQQKQWHMVMVSIYIGPAWLARSSAPDAVGRCPADGISIGWISVWRNGRARMHKSSWAYLPSLFFGGSMVATESLNDFSRQHLQKPLYNFSIILNKILVTLYSVCMKDVLYMY